MDRYKFSSVQAVPMCSHLLYECVCVCVYGVGVIVKIRSLERIREWVVFLYVASCCLAAAKPIRFVSLYRSFFRSTTPLSTSTIFFLSLSLLFHSLPLLLLLFILPSCDMYATLAIRNRSIFRFIPYLYRKYTIKNPFSVFMLIRWSLLVSFCQRSRVDVRYLSVSR